MLCNDETIILKQLDHIKQQKNYNPLVDFTICSLHLTN